MATDQESATVQETTRSNDQAVPGDLQKLIVELKDKIGLLKMQLKPIVQKYHNGEIQTSKGVSFLEVKYQVMLQYVTQLAFYVHMKLSGKKLEGHPVVESLVELRVVLEKMKPIESKLKYQIDKLIRAAVIGTQKQEDPTKTDEITAVANDPLAFKPNPSNLLARDDQEEDEEDEDEDTTTKKTGVYRPPKLAPVVYNEKSEKLSKREKDEERMRERSSRSRVMQDLMAEMQDAPEEADVHGGVHEESGAGDSLDRFIKEKDRYEEDNYVRLVTTRKEKRRRNAKNNLRFDNEFDNLNDFSNLIGIKDVEEQENERFRNVLSRKKMRIRK
ncbi:hypothetical protein VTP01DRAFT_1654 [Rhizomucor pusillus]|uniref:uncharacterized protein n=1 Tax=Rhizomucor pusillus TaxID=4840 RepID=UPI0037441ADE